MLKLFLYFITYFHSIYAYTNKYCEICVNHTLCKYEVTGPSAMCLGYDRKSLLADNDVKTIVDRINHRRNLIALGHSNVLPGAANMKKIVWSQELATFAQRWVDQCDQTLRPDKQDLCRDLENMKVGQNIATIMGSSPGLNVKSFVEVWFMQSVFYPGTVTYYNASNDNKSDQFTQLIWANTEIIGCGKAKFYIKNQKITVVERIVCNFAPRGNIHGKPVYIIGYAATQCADDMRPDIYFSGLCSRPPQPNDSLHKKNIHSGNLFSLTPTVNSLLRIRNLFNDSEKQDIDPVHMNFKHKECIKGHPRINKKTSSIIVQNNSSDAVKRSHPLDHENFWINNRNISRNYIDNFHQQDKGHSRVYHGHDHRIEYDSIHPEAFFKDYRKFDQPTALLNYNKEQNYRTHNMNSQCTRNVGSKIINNLSTECNPCKDTLLKCTRGQQVLPQMTQVCEDPEFHTIATTCPQFYCRCHNLPTACTTTNRCIENPNGEYFNFNYPIKQCPNMLRTLGEFNIDMEKRDQSHHFDSFPNVGSEYYVSTSTSAKSEINPSIRKNLKTLNTKNFDFLNNRKEIYPNYSELKRSVSEDDNKFKPFWQIDGFTNKEQPQLKSMKFTTLAIKKNRRLNKNTSKAKMKTEHITLKFNHDQKEAKKHVSEKYLSFEELMHLRKFNTGNFSGRRINDNPEDKEDNKQLLRNSDALETTESTSEYTANTPFIRMKHCTRKLTCTWTAASLTDGAGSIIPGGAGHVGSRTPPGYVEGCTRTSTCTRDYMNRNKMATLPVETTSPEFDSGDEEDYCERRSLNRRHSNRNNSTNNKSSLKKNESKVNIEHEDRYINETLIDCNCSNENFRNKRNGNMKKIYDKNILNYRNHKRENVKFKCVNTNNIISYGNLYYSVLKKILNNGKRKNSLLSKSRCLCNDTNEINHYNLLLLTSIFIFI